jgi:hypothetical protein
MPKNAQMELDIDVPNPDAEVPDNVTEQDQETEVVLEEKDGETVAVVAEASETPDQGDEKEHEEYSDRVKKRIDKMTAKLREAERREKAALEYAQGVQAQLAQAQQRAQTMDENYVTEASGRIKSQLAIVEANLQDAVERGDGKAAVEAQKMLAQLVLQQERMNEAASRTAAQQKMPQMPQQPAQIYAPPPAQPKPSPKAEEWAEKNEWFGADQAMTYAAFGIHNQLKDEGFDLSSDEYYDELNRRIRKEFPHKFKKQDNVQVNAPTVAPATRGQSSVGTSGRRTVKLTPSEVSMARRLGVPLEEYAKYVRR